MSAGANGRRLPTLAYDFWPWPGVQLLNDKAWPDGVAWENRARRREDDEREQAADAEDVPA